VRYCPRSQRHFLLTRLRRSWRITEAEPGVPVVAVRATGRPHQVGVLACRRLTAGPRKTRTGGTSAAVQFVRVRAHRRTRRGEPGWRSWTSNAVCQCEIAGSAADLNESDVTAYREQVCVWLCELVGDRVVTVSRSLDVPAATATL